MKRRRTFLIVFAILIVILIVGLIALWASRGGLLERVQQGEDIVDLMTPQPTPTPRTPA